MYPLCYTRLYCCPFIHYCTYSPTNLLTHISTHPWPTTTNTTSKPASQPARTFFYTYPLTHSPTFRNSYPVLLHIFNLPCISILFFTFYTPTSLKANPLQFLPSRWMILLFSSHARMIHMLVYFTRELGCSWFLHTVLLNIYPILEYWGIQMHSSVCSHPIYPNKLFRERWNLLCVNWRSWFLQTMPRSRFFFCVCTGIGFVL